MAADRQTAGPGARTPDPYITQSLHQRPPPSSRLLQTPPPYHLIFFLSTTTCLTHNCPRSLLSQNHLPRSPTYLLLTNHHHIVLPLVQKVKTHPTDAASFTEQTE